MSQNIPQQEVVPFNGQAEQDKFVLNVLGFKTNGYFLEIGSNEPIFHNNTYLLENTYDWRGVMVEIDQSFLSGYKQHRPKSIHMIGDATGIDYKKVLDEDKAPLNIDYLQIDLEVSNGSTLKTLQILDSSVMDKYKFAVVTFEHDVYSNSQETRIRSREIFERRGYYRVFDDISNLNNPYEDWYVHPDLVDMKYISELQKTNVDKRTNSNVQGMSSLEFSDIKYMV